MFGGGGGFTFSDVYNLPLHIRRLYVNNLLKIKKAEQEQKAEQEEKVSNSTRHKGVWAVVENERGRECDKVSRG